MLTPKVVVPPFARRAGAAAVLALTLLASASAPAAGQASGSLVDVSVELEGAAAPLYPARDGSGRYYLEARAGCAYALRIRNHSPERIGVLLAVDGLNAISGEREPGPSASSRPGRLYVIDPWDEVRVRGWRTSLEDVRRFTFVDERASYAARTGRANGKMGWIEAWVYRERSGPRVSRPVPVPWDRPSRPEEDKDTLRDREQAEPRAQDGAADAQAPAGSPPPAVAAAPESRAADGNLKKAQPGGESFPGTGWGSQAWDPATVVSFVAEARPSDTVIVRYEYAPALRALGLLPPAGDGDRLRERERGTGFARPPAW